MDSEAWVSPTAERTGTELHDDRTSVKGHPLRPSCLKYRGIAAVWGVTSRCVSEVRRWDGHDAFHQAPLSGPRWGHGADI